jgi:hypothetical protein
VQQRIEKNAKTLIVEGGAIVLSILLAFSIDAWWDDRKERAEETEVLESLYVEFKANRDEAAVVVAAHESAVESVASLVAMSDDEVLALPATDIERRLRYLAYPRTFDAVRGTVDALVSSGKLGILGDRELREALTTFVNILEDVEEDRFYMSRMSLTVWNEVVKNGGPWRIRAVELGADECSVTRPPRNCYFNDQIAFMPVATPPDLLRLRNNPVLMGYVRQTKINAIRYAGEIKQAEIQIAIILDLIEQRITT